MTFGELLRKYRLERNKLKTEVAIAAGCTATYVRRLEKGTSLPPLTSKVHRIIRAVAADEEQANHLIRELQHAHASMRQPSRSIRMKKSIGRREFFLLCEELRNQREVLTTQKPSRAETARILGKKLGFAVSEHAVEDAKEATGIEWTAIRQGGRGTNRDQVTRIVCNAIIQLYQEVGSTPPTALVGLAERATGRILHELHQSGITDTELLNGDAGSK